MRKKTFSQPTLGGTGSKTSAPKHVSSPATPTGHKTRKFPLLPAPLTVFVLLWCWCVLWQGDVFRIIREHSFFATDATLMQYELSKAYGSLWVVGRALLTPFRYPWLGGILLSFLLTANCYLLGYVLHLKAGWRWVQYLPLGIFLGLFTHQGMSTWFEAETGHLMGIPFALFVLLSVAALLLHILRHKPLPALVRRPSDETSRQNALQYLTVLGLLVLTIVFGEWQRPYVRVTASMQVGVMEQDWERVIQLGKKNADLSYRPMAAHYAIALVQTGRIGDSMFDIRLDYDSLHIVGMDGEHNTGINSYQMECDYHAGLVQTAYHHAMENLSMEGPTIRNLKMLCKTALLRSEWALAEKYLYILGKVPFEGAFVEKYQAMLHQEQRVNEDKEMAMVRLLEPLHDDFENHYTPPVFLGYNARLTEGRSPNALWNSLMVNLYTKTMEPFLQRLQPLQGTMPAKSFSEAVTLMSNKYPELNNAFGTAVQMHLPLLQSFVQQTKQYMGTTEQRSQYARQLFPQYRGYYPYYYFFGNLKATRKSKATQSSSNSGVN